MTDETATKQRRKNLNDLEHYQAMSLLQAHLRTSTDDVSEWRYATGWSDQQVATVVGCTLNNIVGLRERVYGRLAKGEFVLDPRVEDLIIAHNDFVRAITEWINSPLTRTAKFDVVSYLVEDSK